MNYLYIINSIKGSKKIVFSLLLIFLLAYFIFHSIYGNKGIIAYFTLNQRLEKAYAELEDSRAKRVELEHRVKLLRPESLDRDMLDQEARRVLGVASPKEQVFTVNLNSSKTKN
jgi:cell division protein FtsB